MAVLGSIMECIMYSQYKKNGRKCGMAVVCPQLDTYDEAKRRTERGYS